MKKSLRTIMISILAIMFVFVSCNPAMDNADKVGRVILMTDGAATKSLTVADPSFDASTLYWKYATQKVDTLEFKTGQTSSCDETGAVEVTAGRPGLSGKVGPFSQGLWNFKLFAYTDPAYQDLAWSGETLNQKIVAGDANRVAVKVTAKQTDGKTGSLAIGDIVLKDGTSVQAALDRSNLTQIVEYWKEGTEQETALTDSSTAPFTSLIADIPSGGYWVVVKYVDTSDTSTVRGSEKKFVNIFDNVTTTIGGFISEDTGSADLDAQSEIKKAVSPVVTVQNDQPTKLEVAATPESGKTEQKTAVAIPAGVLKAEDGDAKVDVTTYTAPKANEMFTVTDDSGATALAGIDLTLTQTTAGEVKTFNEPVTVTTYIAKGLEPANIGVKYNGEGTQPTFEANDLSQSPEAATGYNPTTGELRFQTDHFSQFFVVAKDVVAIDVNTNIGYSRFEDAIAVDKGHLVLLKDVTITAGKPASGVNCFNVHSEFLDLSDKTITLNVGALQVDGTSLIIDGSSGGKIMSTANSEIWSILRVVNGGALEIIGGTYSSSGYCILGGHDEGNVNPNDVVVENASFNSKWGVWTVNGTDTSENNLTLIDCNAIGGGLGYFAGEQNVKVLGGTYSSTNGDAVLYQKAGAVLLDGCVIKPEVKLGNTWGHRGGSSTSGPAAVIVEACGYPADQPKITVKDTVVFEDPQNNAPYDVLLIDWREDNNHNYYRTITDGIGVPYRYAEVTCKTGSNVIIDDSNSIEIDTTWYGSNASDFSISKPAELAGLSKLVSEGITFKDKTIALTDNIDLAGMAWKPIGTIYRKGKDNAGGFLERFDGDKEPNGNGVKRPGSKLEVFQGTFDGGNHSIDNLSVKVDDGDKTVAGLFGLVGDGAVIKNVTVNGSVFNSTDAAGGIAGMTIGNVEFNNCTNNAVINKDPKEAAHVGGSAAGGIVGRCYANHNIGEVTTADTCIVKLIGCTNTGDVFSHDGKSGGLIGYVDNTYDVGNLKHHVNVEIIDCTNSGTVCDDTKWAGGFVGQLSNKLTVSGGTMSGTVKGGEKTGDIVGFVDNYPYVKLDIVEGKDPVVMSLWDGTSDTEWYSDGPTSFSISNAAQLKGLSDLVAAGNTFAGKTVCLERDIDLDSIEWTPIGTTNRDVDRNAMFQGNFNGKGHVVSNLKVTQADDTKSGDGTAIGLFGCVSAGTIENLTIASGLVENKYDAAAGFVGAAYALDENHPVTISNCVNGATVKASNKDETGCAAAGFVARAKTGVNIINCINRGPVIVESGKAGGTASMQYNQCHMNITGCRNEAPISSTYVGAGILAWAGDPRHIMQDDYYLKLEDCVNTGDITVAGAYIPPESYSDRYGDQIIAVIEGNNPPMVNCSGTGNVTVDKVVQE